MFDEEAKAVQEASRAAGRALDILHDSGRFFAEVFGEPFRHIGGAIGEWSRYVRYRNFLIISDKVDSLHKRRRVEGKRIPVPPEYALQLIDGASLESEPELQELWAGLIANATDPERDTDVRKVFIELLRGMERLDAALLELLAKDDLQRRYGPLTEGNLNAREISRLLEEDIEEVKISLQTLARYGCIIDAWQNSLENLDVGYGGFRVENEGSNFRLSHLGEKLMKAVSTR